MVILTTHANFPWYVTQAVLAVFIGVQRGSKFVKEKCFAWLFVRVSSRFSRAARGSTRELETARADYTREAHEPQNRPSTDLLKLKVC